MDGMELTALLKNRRELTKPGWRCPDDNVLAGYFSKQIDEKQRQKLEAHFADCKPCLETLAFLANTIDEPSKDSVPAHLLTRARALASDKPSLVWRWRWAMAAAAACFVLVFALVIWNLRAPQTPTNLIAQNTEPSRPVGIPEPKVEVRDQQPTSPVQKPTPSTSRAPLVRGPANEVKPIIVFPKDGASVRIAQQPLRWKAIADASFYVVKVVSEDGSAVLTESTPETQLEMKSSELKPGGKYFVTIDAHLNGGRTVKSELVSFRVAGP
jgi:hypothetical protein